MPELDDEFGRRQRVERVEESLERVMVGSHRDEDQRTLPSKRIRGLRVACGHCTKNSSASGYTRRPLSETDSILVRLST